MKNLFVGNISFQTSEAELQALFEPFGEVTRVQILTDRETGRSRGFGFVEMANDEDAAKAIGALNGKEVNGRALNVNEARPKPEGGFGGRGGGYGRGGGESRGGGFGRQRREPRW
jgi:RNA recognition motif-containing protein